MNLRRLGTLDFLSLKSLLAEQKTFFGVPATEFPNLLSKQTLTKLFINLVNQKDEIIFGAFDDEVLQGAVLFKLVPEEKLCVVRLVVICEQLKGKSKPLLSKLLATAISFGESNGYFKNIFVVPAAHITKNGSWVTEASLNDYIFQDVELVKAGELPTNKIFDTLLFGRKPFPVDAMIREGVLDNRRSTFSTIRKEHN